MENNAKLLVGTLVGTLLLIIGVSVFFSGSNTSSEQVTVDQTVLLEGATNIKGATGNPIEPTVTIVEFSDFQCPACASAAPVLSSLVESYPQVQFVYRHFPLISIHRNAIPAGQAAEAAAQQGKFWEMHDALFASQATWSNQSNPTDTFMSLAQDLQLDESAFRAAYESSETREIVMRDLRLAEQLKLGSTPSLYYNGELMNLSQVASRLAADFSSGAALPVEETVSADENSAQE